MSNLNPIKSGTAALLALSITSSAIVPLVTTTPAFAQSRPSTQSSYNRFIPAGTSISVRYDKDKVLLMPNEKVPLTLTVARDVKDRNGYTLVAEGSEIKGELRPSSSRGTQFVAKELIVYPNLGENQSRSYYINATSNVVTRTEEVKKGANTTSILTGTALGAGAAAAIAALTGDRSIDLTEVLGGAGLGTLAGVFFNRKKVTMVAVYPERDLAVKLRSDIALR